MFKKVMFRWSDQPKLDSYYNRKVWVETIGGDRGLLTYEELDDMVGDKERRRLVRLAIRNGCGKWHKENKAILTALPN